MTCSAVILFVSAIAVTPLVVVLVDSTSLSAAVAGPSNRLRPTRSYTTLWDATAPRISRAGTAPGDLGCSETSTTTFRQTASFPSTTEAADKRPYTSKRDRSTGLDPGHWLAWKCSTARRSRTSLMGPQRGDHTPRLRIFRDAGSEN